MGQRQAISIKGLTPGVAYQLAQCCHPIPGDRIVGLRREDEEIEVHVIGCDTLASGIDADWLDLAWQEVLNSDAKLYGGGGWGNLGGVRASPVPAKGRRRSLALTLPALSTLVFRHEAHG